MKKITKWILTLLACVLLSGLSVVAAGGSASVTSCVINPSDNSKVSVKVQAGSGIQTDDGVLYLFAVPTYVDSVSEQNPVASVSYSGSREYQFSVNLNHNTTASLLYSKFVVGVKSGGGYKAITNGNFITNPEVIAASQAPRIETASKKGLQIDFYIPTDLEDIGVKHSFFNMQFDKILSNTATEISYIYNGKTYYFSPQFINDYDVLISNMTKAGMSVSIALLNGYSYGYEYLVPEGVTQNSGTINYAVNTSTQKGLEAISAATHFLAERYSGLYDGYGRVENWIIGNEVNDNLQYNYMGEHNLDTYVREYLQSFRVMYTAIKSAYSNANVYVCLQHRWKTQNGLTDYAGRDFIDKFSAYAKQQGDMDWGLAYHPYSFPLNDADILNDGEATKDQHGNDTYGGEVTDSVDTSVITMKNLHQLTNYFHRNELLNADGEVRSIILSEQGFTSYSNITGKNEAKQAANIALAYYMAEMNEDIDAFILRGHSDANEGSEFYKFGIWNVNAENGKPTTAKFVYDLYKHIDTEESLKYTEFAKAALNITDWSSVVKNWNSNVFASMGKRTVAPLYTADSVSGNLNVVDVMWNEWEKGYNVYDIGQFDYAPSYRPDGVAVADGNAYYIAYQGVEKKFNTPLNLTNTPYLTLDINFKAKDSSGASDRLELKIRVHSGDSVLDAVGIIAVNQDYKVCVDLSQWSGSGSVDAIEVLNREYGQQKAFDGTFSVYNVEASSNVWGMNTLVGIAKNVVDLSNVELAYQGSFEYSGKAVTPEVHAKLNGKSLVQHIDYDVIYHDNVESGTGKIVVVGIGNYTGYKVAEFTIQGDYPTVYNGVDYSLVYAYGYYKENYPEVVAEVGEDPNALLAHFVNKGMKYALQGIGSFNVLAYSKINDDLEPKYGDDWKAYYMHYLEYGLEENRSISGTKPSDMEAPVYPVGGSSGGDNSGSNPNPGTGENAGGNTAEVIKTTPMYRLYNPNSGEHFYTGSVEERDILTAAGWQYEGIAWNAPISGGNPVYRVYNPNSGDHHFTMSWDEVEMLVNAGWIYENVAWNSAPQNHPDAMILHRLYNPNADCGSHHYTGSVEERDFLVSVGWIYEGVGWFGLVK